MNFKTLAIHARHGSRGASGRGDDAHLPDLHVCFPRRGPAGAISDCIPAAAILPERRWNACWLCLEGGTAGFAFGTGMAAEATLLMMFASGDHVVVHDDLYGGTYRLFESVFANKQIRARYVDLRKRPAKLRSALAAKPKAVWVESPTNPLMNLVDIRAVSEMAHEYGALVI